MHMDYNTVEKKISFFYYKMFTDHIAVPGIDITFEVAASNVSFFSKSLSTISSLLIFLKMSHSQFTRKNYS